MTGRRLLRVAVDASRGFEGRPTGTERYAHALIHALAARRDLSLELYLRQAPIEALPEAVPWTVLRPPRLWTHGPFAAALWRSRADVAFIPAHVMPLLTRLPVVVTVHDLGHRHWPAAHTLAQRHYLEWSTRRHVQRAAGLVADSAATAADLQSLYGADPGRITVAPLGVDDRWTPADESAISLARSAVSLPADAPYLLHVGTVQPRKNLLRLVEAFSRLARRHPSLHLVLAGGSGWGSESLSGAAGDAGSRLILPGYVDDELLPGLYSGASVVVVPSLHEGFGLPALEAMACGAPVAVSDRSSLPEVVGDAGLCFDPLDVAAIEASVARLLEDEGLRVKLQDRGRERARRFTWQACADRVAEALHRASERKQG